MKGMKSAKGLFLFPIIVLFLNTAFAPEFPKALEQYYNNPDAKYGPAVGTCRTDADCERYNYDRNSCLATWAGYLDPTISYDERLKDWRVIRDRKKDDPLYVYIGGRPYSRYMFSESFRYKCINGKCVLDTKRSKTERVFCEYGCDLWLQHCLCMPKDLMEFRCSDDLTVIEGLTLRWTCEKQWIVWTDCAAMGARCGEDPRHPGYLACIKPSGSLVPDVGSQYATLYPIRGGKPIKVAVNTGKMVNTDGSFSKRLITGHATLNTRTINRTASGRNYRTNSSYRNLSSYTYRRTYYTPRTTRNYYTPRSNYYRSTYYTRSTYTRSYPTYSRYSHYNRYSYYRPYRASTSYAYRSNRSANYSNNNTSRTNYYSRYYYSRRFS